MGTPIRVFLVTPLVPWRAWFIEREIKYTTRCTVKSSTIFTGTLIVIVPKKRKIACDKFWQYSKSGLSKLCLCLKQEVELWNKWSCVNDRAFRAASYGMFWSLVQFVKQRKISLFHSLQSNIQRPGVMTKWIFSKICYYCIMWNMIKEHRKIELLILYQTV